MRTHLHTVPLASDLPLNDRHDYVRCHRVHFSQALELGQMNQVVQDAPKLHSHCLP